MKGAVLEVSGGEAVVSINLWRVLEEKNETADKPKRSSRYCRRIANHHNWNWDVFGHLAARRIRLAAWTIFMRAGRTSSHLRVLRPQSGLTHI